MDDSIRNKVAELLAQMGYELWDYSSGHGFINIYADRKEGGITVGECAKITESVEFSLLQGDVLLGNHAITVSSPGINRRLITEDHFRWALGKKIRIVTRDQVDGRSFFEGILNGMENGVIRLLENERKPEISIQFAQVKEAKVNEV